MMRIAMIAATPRTCQPTEMLLNRATSGEEKMLIIEWSTRNSANSANVSPSTCLLSPKLMNPRSSPYIENSASANWAEAYTTEATTPTRPTKLNQPVNQP